MSPGLLIGAELAAWLPPPFPDHTAMRCARAEVVPLSPDHADQLFDAFDGYPELWDYLGAGPFDSRAEFSAWITGLCASRDPQFYAIRTPGGTWTGMASYLRITPEHGVIEVGHLCFGPALKGTPAATAAMVLMMERAFSLGYRRYEWKCNANNLPSRRAAQRLGFAFEGIFRQHMVVKGRSRDTAWFAITDQDWPGLKTAYDAWFDPSNFDAEGRQTMALTALTGPLLLSRDPGIE